MHTLYDLLQVNPKADPEVLAAAFRALAKRYHPDVNKVTDANKVMTEINHAYKILSNPVARAEYDMFLSAPQVIRPSEQTAPFRKSEGHPDKAPATGQVQGKTSGPKVSVQNSDGRFIAYDNGTVLDTSSSLMWAAKDNGSDINWHGAKRYCENYREGGYTNWRLPTQDELAGLYDVIKSRPAVCSRNFNIHVATELIDITCFSCWASDTRRSEAARFSFIGGGRLWGPQSGVRPYYRALPVRSGK